MNNITILLVLLSSLIAGCGISPVYVTAEPRYITSPQTPRLSSSLIVHFKPVVPGKRFDQTVCDNIQGAIWDPEESKKIGFTQDRGKIYSNVIPQLLPSMAIEASLPNQIGIGRVASGQSSLNWEGIKVESRIMVPFGTYISRNLEQLLETTGSKSNVCFDEDCVRQARQSSSKALLLNVNFKKLFVAEIKSNTLTLAMDGVVEVSDANTVLRQFPIGHEILNRSVTSEGHYEGGFLKVMNKVSNEFSSVIADQILTRALMGNVDPILPPDAPR